MGYTDFIKEGLKDAGLLQRRDFFTGAEGEDSPTTGRTPSVPAAASHGAQPPDSQRKELHNATCVSASPPSMSCALEPAFAATPRGSCVSDERLKNLVLDRWGRSPTDMAPSTALLLASLRTARCFSDCIFHILHRLISCAPNSSRSEKRRREKINGKLSELRDNIPLAAGTGANKTTVLKATVEHIRALNTQYTQLLSINRQLQVRARRRSWVVCCVCCECVCVLCVCGTFTCMHAPRHLSHRLSLFQETNAHLLNELREMHRLLWTRARDTLQPMPPGGGMPPTPPLQPHAQHAMLPAAMMATPYARRELM